MSAGWWATSSWRGHPQYLCEECPYDSLDADEIAEHVSKVHGPKVTMRRTMIEVVDKHGRPMPAVVVEQEPANPGASE